MSHCFYLMKYDFLPLDDQQKGRRGHCDRYVGTCRFVNEVNMIRHSQLAAAVRPAKLAQMEVASLWW